MISRARAYFAELAKSGQNWRKLASQGPPRRDLGAGPGAGPAKVGANPRQDRAQPAPLGASLRAAPPGTRQTWQGPHGRPPNLPRYRTIVYQYPSGTRGAWGITREARPMGGAGRTWGAPVCIRPAGQSPSCTHPRVYPGCGKGPVASLQT